MNTLSKRQELETTPNSKPSAAQTRGRSLLSFRSRLQEPLCPPGIFLMRLQAQLMARRFEKRKSSRLAN